MIRRFRIQAEERRNHNTIYRITVISETKVKSNIFVNISEIRFIKLFGMLKPILDLLQYNKLNFLMTEKLETITLLLILAPLQ